MAARSGSRGGSDRGQAAIDWGKAFAFYASLPPGERSYAAVAAEFGVSPRTVEKHGRLEGWKGRLQTINRQAAEETERTLGHARAEQASKYLRLIEASLIGYAEKLRSGEMRMGPADLERLHRLSQELTLEPVEPQPAPPGRPDASRSAEHLAEVIDALHTAGALRALGLTTLDHANNDASREEQQ